MRARVPVRLVAFSEHRTIVALGVTSITALALRSAPVHLFWTSNPNVATIVDTSLGITVAGTATTRRAKLFTSGGSQAVRLPAEYRFEASEVYVHRDGLTGDVILSSRPRSSWDEFEALRAELGPLPADFLADREQPSETRDPLRGLEP